MQFQAPMGKDGAREGMRMLRFRCREHCADWCGATQIQWVVVGKVTGKFPKKVTGVTLVIEKCVASIKVHWKKGDEQNGSLGTMGRQKSDVAGSG